MIIAQSLLDDDRKIFCIRFHFHIHTQAKMTWWEKVLATMKWWLLLGAPWIRMMLAIITSSSHHRRSFEALSNSQIWRTKDFLPYQPRIAAVVWSDEWMNIFWKEICSEKIKYSTSKCCWMLMHFWPLLTELEKHLIFERFLLKNVFYHFVTCREPLESLLYYVIIHGQMWRKLHVKDMW